MMEMVSLWGFFVTGFLGGIGHCVGMCGPFVLYISSRYVGEGKRSGDPLVPHLYYNAGRVVTYVLLGVAAGLVGGLLRQGGLLLGVQRGGPARCRWIFGPVRRLLADGRKAVAAPGRRGDLAPTGGGPLETRSGASAFRWHGAWPSALRSGVRRAHRRDCAGQRVGERAGDGSVRGWARSRRCSRWLMSGSFSSSGGAFFARWRCW